MNQLENELPKIIERIDQKINPISIITQLFTDLDLKNRFLLDYDVQILNKSMNWTQFLEWFYSVVGFKTLFSDRTKKMMIINTDMITRKPSKQRKKAVKDDGEESMPNEKSMEYFVNYVINKVSYPVIFFSEQPIKAYRMIVEPIIMGNIIDYSNPIYIAEQILYNKNEKEVIDALEKYGSLYDFVIAIINYSLRNTSEGLTLAENIKSYFKMKFELKIDIVREFLAKSFKLDHKVKVVYPPNFKNVAECIVLKPEIMKNI